MLITSENKIERVEQVQTLQEPQFCGEFLIIEMPEECKGKTYRIVMEEIKLHQSCQNCSYRKHEYCDGDEKGKCPNVLLPDNLIN